MTFKEEKPIYLQIEDYVCEQILSGKWPQGERLCSVRELAAQVEVNPNTVQRAYTELSDKHVIENKRGIGFYVTANAVELIREEHRQYLLCHTLPSLLKKAKLLNISNEEIMSIYQNIENQ